MISQSKYVSITSGLGGAAAATEKELIARIFTANGLIPANTVLEFTSSESVNEYFGSASAESAIADKYFGFTNKYLNAPRKISFYRDDTDGAKPSVRGGAKPVLATLQAIEDGSMSVSMGGTSYAISDIDLSSATSFSDIAAIIQTAIRGNTAGGELWTSATFTFDSVNQVFVLTGGLIGECTIVAPAAHTSGTDLSVSLGLNTTKNPILSQGTDAHSYTDLLNKSFNLSNNFGSFNLIDSLSSAEIEEVSQWTHGKNMQCMYSARVTSVDYSTVQNAVKDYNGVALTYDNYSTDSLSWVIPMAVMASTDYDRIDGSVSFDYIQAAGTAVSVDSDSMYDNMDGKNINFYGATQQSGKQIAFYQHGVLQGSVKDMGVYANEVWIKDAMATAYLNYQLASNKWPANDSGVIIGRTVAQEILDRSLKNGVISVGKQLTDLQKAYISQVTGDTNAWQEIYLNGYYLIGKMTEKTVGSSVKYVYEYTLIYSKSDIVRFVDGTHILI